MAYDDALKSGALAFFDEKYGDKVRVVRVGLADSPFSVELCGGTHLSSASDIVFFKIQSEASVASGVRRIEAIAADSALHYLLERANLLRELEQKFGTTEVVKKADQMAAQIKTLSRENEDLKLKVAQSGQGGGGGQALHERAVRVGEFSVVTEIVPQANVKILRTLVDQIRDKLKEKTVVLLATTQDGKVSLCLGVTQDLVTRCEAGKLIGPLAKLVEGTGGGRADFAQAGGPRSEGIPEAFEKLKSLLQES